MNPDEFLERMEEIFAPFADAETSHMEADDLMCELLETLGYDEGVEVFREAHKYYA